MPVIVTVSAVELREGDAGLNELRIAKMMEQPDGLHGSLFAHACIVLTVDDDGLVQS